jgi:hypothetical protein
MHRLAILTGVPTLAPLLLDDQPCNNIICEHPSEGFHLSAKGVWDGLKSKYQKKEGMSRFLALQNCSRRAAAANSRSNCMGYEETELPCRSRRTGPDIRLAADHPVSVNYRRRGREYAEDYYGNTGEGIYW